MFDIISVFKGFVVAHVSRHFPYSKDFFVSFVFVVVLFLLLMMMMKTFWEDLAHSQEGRGQPNDACLKASFYVIPPKYVDQCL